MLDIFSSVGDLFSGITDSISSAVTGVFEYILYNFVYKVFYWVMAAFCRLVWLGDNLYEVFTGSRRVYYDGNTNFLVNVFFQNHTINNVYWGMALLGIVFAFAFAIIAVIRRIFDLRDKDQRTMGQILGSLFKTILLIISMNFIMIVVLNATNLLMQQINFVFDNADTLNQADSIEFTDEQFAAMARVLNTIGNYSTNPSYQSRYNVNACYNAIRPDLQYLTKQGVFDYYYGDTRYGTSYVTVFYGKVDNDKKQSEDSWQSVLQEIVNAHDVNTDMKLDVYNESVQNSILNAIEILKTNQNLRPLKSFKRDYTVTKQHITLDRFVFLLATMEAAKNPEFNKNPSMTDAVRGPYYYGQKSIYSLDDVNQDFDISITKFNYIIGYLAGIALAYDLAIIILTCVTRIFNMLMLYLISPLVFAAEPLDDGAKRKQWTTAFLVQSMGVFGTIVAMRVLMVFIPIVIGPQLHFFKYDLSNPDFTSADTYIGYGYAILDLAAKAIMIYGGFEVVKKANGIITGILADSAGWQSISAGDMSDSAKSTQNFFSTFTRHPLNTVKGLFGGGGSGGSGGGGGGGAGGGGSGGGGGGGTNLPGSQR